MEDGQTGAGRGFPPGTPHAHAHVGGRGSDVPEVEHLDVRHPAQHPHQQPRRLDPRPYQRQLPQPRQALQRARVLQEVVVQVQHPHIRHKPPKVGGQRCQPTRRQLQVDQVVAGLRDKSTLEGVAWSLHKHKSARRTSLSPNPPRFLRTRPTLAKHGHSMRLHSPERYRRFTSRTSCSCRLLDSQVPKKN